MESPAVGVINALREKQIPLKVATDPDWYDYATSFNNRLGYPPDVIVVPWVLKHISDTVITANQKGAKVQARSGGHSYTASGSRKMGSYTLIVVDLRMFQTIQSFPSKFVVEGGVRLGKLAHELYSRGGHALAHGTCPSVGIGGHFTHGGYGHTSRAWGLAMDHIVGMDVVTADGCCVRASAADNEHLYWAMRGAADSFGIVVKFHLKTRPAPQQTLRFSIECPDMALDDKACAKAVMALQHLAQQEFFDKGVSFGIQLAPDRFGISGISLNELEYESSCVRRIYDTLEELNQAHTDDLMRALGFGNPCAIKHEVLNWIDLVKDLEGDDPLITPQPFTNGSSFYANSIMVPHGFAPETLKNYFRYIRENKPAPIRWFTIIDLWGGHDSEIFNPLGVQASAFRRDAFWVVQNYGYVDKGADFPLSGLDFMRGLHDAMASFIPVGGAYANYSDSALTREQAGHMYYGSSYGKLKALKKLLDPNDVFHNAQSIGASE